MSFFLINYFIGKGLKGQMDLKGKKGLKNLGHGFLWLNKITMFSKVSKKTREFKILFDWNSRTYFKKGRMV
jgi:hypothetical protein